MDLETIVRDLGHDVTGVAVTRDEAVAQAKARRPGLVLADIQLADDSSGIDAVKDILAEFNVPVIVEVILERVTNISMGTEIDAINEFEELAEKREDAPTAISMLD